MILHQKAAACGGIRSHVPALAWAADPIKIGVDLGKLRHWRRRHHQCGRIGRRRDQRQAGGYRRAQDRDRSIYDDHNSAADAVRAFQRAASQDHVNAVIATYTSEVALALQPWSGRLKIPTITPGASSDELSRIGSTPITTI